MRWLLVFVLLVGCGSRTGLGERNADAGSRPIPVPGTDAGDPPPPMGCALGPLRGPYVDGSPAFLYSLTRYEDPLADSEGEYLVTYAQGWPPDTRGEMALLDFGLDGFFAQSPSPGELSGARQRDFWIAHVVSEDDDLFVRWLDIRPGLPEERARSPICSDCNGSWSAFTPVFDGERVAFAATHRRDAVLVFTEPAGGGAGGFVTSFPDEGAPRLAAHRDGHVLVSTSIDREATLVRFLDTDLAPRSEAVVPIRGTGEPPGLVVREDDAIVIGREGPDGGLHAVLVEEERGMVRAEPLPGGDTLVLGIDVARDRGLLALTLEDLDGVSVLVVDESSFEVVFGPMPITERGSYRRSPHIETHPEGFAIVYGGWEPGGTYGIYGRLLRCEDAG